MDVALGAGTVVLPGLSAIGRSHQTAELDADEEDLRVVRARRDPADMRGPRSWREAPRGPGRQVEQAFQLDPRVAAVVAAVESRRLGACIQGAVRGAHRHGEDRSRFEPALDPGLSSVLGPTHAALAQTGVDGVRLRRVSSEAVSAALLEREHGGPSIARVFEAHDRVARRREESRAHTSLDAAQMLMSLSVA
ncbi:MAG: hypothetical protein E6G20_10920 [Actinobacteria bacterium]|nr:MAG: hypothetical protein E6G20_10920 [Actinomycetota bacterium]